MQHHALIQDGIVQEVITIAPGEAPLAARYHPDILARLVAVGAEVAPGFVALEGGGFAPPPNGPSLAEVRARRDALLAGTDWTQLPDAPLSAELRADWAAYRAALRGLPGQPGFPEKITWPEEPPPAASLTREAQP